MAAQSARNDALSHYGRRIYKPTGFTRGYNFILFVVFGGAFLGFALSRLQFLNFNGIFCGGGGTGTAPGECYWYTRFYKYKLGVILHLAGILPAACLAVLQFVPVIRHRVLLFHRINGWVISLLVILGDIGAIIITPHAFGGDLSIQSVVGALVIMTTVGLALAIYNIKRLQIDQHRAWMLRTWFYFGSIITQRFILIITANLISLMGHHHIPMECAKIEYIMKERSATLQAYPNCAAYYNGTEVDQSALVKANFNGSVEQIAASLNVAFGMSMWLALWMHAIGVEIYLHLTPREAQRLREVSYQRQLEAGSKHPRSAGLPPDYAGDAEKGESEVTAGASNVTDDTR